MTGIGPQRDEAQWKRGVEIVSHAEHSRVWSNEGAASIFDDREQLVKVHLTPEIDHIFLRKVWSFTHAKEDYRTLEGGEELLPVLNWPISFVVVVCFALDMSSCAVLGKAKTFTESIPLRIPL